EIATVVLVSSSSACAASGPEPSSTTWRAELLDAVSAVGWETRSPATLAQEKVLRMMTPSPSAVTSGAPATQGAPSAPVTETCAPPQPALGAPAAASFAETTVRGCSS